MEYDLLVLLQGDVAMFSQPAFRRADDADSRPSTREISYFMKIVHKNTMICPCFPECEEAHISDLKFGKNLFLFVWVQIPSYC